MKSQAETLFEKHLTELKLPFEREYRFHPERRWRADFYLPEQRIIIEMEGGAGYFQNPKGQIIRGGRHTREKGFENDMRKYNQATVMGYRVLRFSTNMVLRGEAKAFLAEHLGL